MSPFQTVASLPITASDGMAVTMVVLLACAFGIVFTIVFTIARNSGRKHQIEDDVIHPDPKPPVPKSAGTDVPPKEKREGWQRDPDWWQE